VVALVARHDLVPAGRLPGDADGVLDRLGAAVGEQGPVQVARRHLGQHLRQPGGRPVGEVGADDRQLGGLPADPPPALRGAVPMEEVVRLHMSSGTTGRPVVTGYTRGDLDRWAECMARVLAAGEVGERDVLQNAYGYGLFTGGLGFHAGAERLGCVVVPTSS